MQEPPVSEYDKFAYPSAVYSQTHPERLAVIATLMGVRPVSIERARVLELGCGDGNNVITMACTLPGSNFLGIDLAVEPIRRGQELIADLGLKNVVLRQMNVLEALPDLGTFDYIIAHGLYSWVPGPVREKILALCREHLSEYGVAYISYNAYPGCHLREATRRMMQFHIPRSSEPQEQVRQARVFLKFLAEAKSKPGHWQGVVQNQFERLEKYNDGGFFHDDLSPVYQPFYFYEFMEAAARHQLKFLGESDLCDMQPDGLTEEALQIVRKMESVNLIAREQYLDFISGRGFRQTLLCRQEQRPDHEPKPERVFGLFAAGDTAPVNPEADHAAPGLEDFRRGKIVIATSQPMLKSSLKFLGEIWPRRVPFAELLKKASERAGLHNNSSEASLESDQRDLGEFLLRCFSVSFVDLHAYPSTFVTEISDRPMASPLVRRQVRNSPIAASLRHLSLKIEDALGRELLRLLDGTRDRAALLEELGKTVASGATPIYCDGNRVTDPKKALELLASQLETSLANLAKAGVLVG